MRKTVEPILVRTKLPNVTFVRRVDTIGMIKKTRKGHEAWRLSQFLGCYTEEDRAQQAVLDAEDTAGPDTRLTKEQYMHFVRANIEDAVA